MALDIEKSSVQTYLSMLQGVIARMTSNSANCKTWCVTVVSAILVLAVDTGKPQAIPVGLVPVVLFFLLDAYYLSLERDFRDIYASFVNKLHEQSATEQDVFLLQPASGFGHRIGAVFGCIFSLSVIPFYGFLTAALFVTKILMDP